MGKIGSAIKNYIAATDKVLFILTLVICLYGSVMVFSTTYRHDGWMPLVTQLGAIVLGFGLAIVISLINLEDLGKLWWLIALFVLFLLGLTAFIGYAPDGTNNKAWLSLPFGMSLQPSELLKIAFLITFGVHVQAVKEHIERPITTLLLFLHGLVPAALIHFLQHDDGTAIILFIMFLCMICASGVKKIYFAITGAIIAIAAPIIWFFALNDYQKERVLVLFNPSSALQDTYFQQQHALITMASGGFFGTGLLKGPHVQSYTFLPKGYNDFIFASTGEELGFLGCMVIILLLVAICIRILYIAVESRDEMGKIICIGIFGIIAGQTIINIGMNLGITPVIGVTLPFFSAGGTSVLALLIGIGLVLNVFIHKNQKITFLNE